MNVIGPSLRRRENRLREHRGEKAPRSFLKIPTVSEIPPPSPCKTMSTLGFPHPQAEHVAALEARRSRYRPPSNTATLVAFKEARRDNHPLPFILACNFHRRPGTLTLRDHLIKRSSSRVDSTG